MTLMTCLLKETLATNITAFRVSPVVDPLNSCETMIHNINYSQDYAGVTGYNVDSKIKICNIQNLNLSAWISLQEH